MILRITDGIHERFVNFANILYASKLYQSGTDGSPVELANDAPQGDKDYWGLRIYFVGRTLDLKGAELTNVPPYGE